ncbi:MAG: hypothetical protein ACI835_001098 [Planctomycetota bacterium]
MPITNATRQPGVATTSRAVIGAAAAYAETLGIRPTQEVYIEEEYFLVNDFGVMDYEQFLSSE